MRNDSDSDSEFPFSDRCDNETMLEHGYCYGYVLCGLCYGGGFRIASPVYDLYNLIIIGILLPIVGCFGIVGDLLSAFVYSRPCMRSSVNVYLCALAGSDVTIIATAFFLFFLENMRKHSVSVAYYYAKAAPVMYPLGLTAQTCSVFFTVAAAFDCYVTVVGSAAWRQRCCTVRRSMLIVVVIVLIACLYNVSHLFEVYIVDCWSSTFNEITLDVCPTEFRADPVYIQLYYVYGYTFVMAGGPVFLLLVLNSAIIIGSRRKRRRSAESHAGGTDVITLVLVVFLFIFCNTLALIVNVLEIGFGEHEFVLVAISYLVDVSNFLVVCNSSANFSIYYAFGDSFRGTLKDYLCTKRSIRAKSPQARHRRRQLTNGNTVMSSNTSESHAMLTNAPSDNCAALISPRTNANHIDDVEQRLMLLAGPKEILI